MFIHEFPDLNWLKKKIADGFRDKKGVAEMPLKQSGWPSVVLNTRVKQAERRDIKGPFSLFLNISGNSLVRTDGQDFHINELCFGLSNAGQYYDLIIDETSVTETYNVHFGEHFFRESVRALSHTHAQLLDEPFSYQNEELNLTPHTSLRTPGFNRILYDLQHAYKQALSEDREEEILYELLQEVLTFHSDEMSKAALLRVQSASVRQEITGRLFSARDYIHAHYGEVFSLEQLSRISCLSKFHFLRLFKAFFGVTPYQYQKQLRFQRALELYKQGETLESIAPVIGMENASSVSRMFHKQSGQYPSQLVTTE